MSPLRYKFQTANILIDLCRMTEKNRGKDKKNNCYKPETCNILPGVSGEAVTVTTRHRNQFGRKSVCATPSMETVQHNCTPRKQVSKL